VCDNLHVYLQRAWPVRVAVLCSRYLGSLHHRPVGECIVTAPPTSRCRTRCSLSVLWAREHHGFLVAEERPHLAHNLVLQCTPSLQCTPGGMDRERTRRAHGHVYPLPHTKFTSAPPFDRLRAPMPDPSWLVRPNRGVRTSDYTPYLRSLPPTLEPNFEFTIATQPDKNVRDI
jgi:hypothetical protein